MASIGMSKRKSGVKKNHFKRSDLLWSGHLNRL